MDRHLSPSETARRFGVSTKALRLYERHGLIQPVRSDAGWRTYGPDQVARLVQILALKRLGLPLARIAKLLGGRDELAAVLALQEDALTRDSQRLSRALAVVRDARQRLASGAALSIDDLATLAKETVMTSTLNARDMGKLLKPFADHHLSESERQSFRARVVDRGQTIRDLNALIAEAESLMDAGADTASPPVQDMARRWMAFAGQFTDADHTVRDKARAVWDDAMGDPGVAAKLARNRTVFRFVQRAIDHEEKVPAK